MIFSQMCINFGPALKEGAWVGGGEGQVGVGWVGVRDGEGEGKSPR